LFSVGAQEGKKWQNPTKAVDVNADGVISPLDALLVINYLNTALRLPPPEFQKPYLDVSGDDAISPLDALLVINHLNSRAVNGEGESTASNRLLSSIPQCMHAFVDDYQNWAVPPVERGRLKRQSAQQGYSRNSTNTDEWDLLLEGIAADVAGTL
jgi:Dockerin type I domain